LQDHKSKAQSAGKIKAMNCCNERTNSRKRPCSCIDCLKDYYSIEPFLHKHDFQHCVAPTVW